MKKKMKYTENTESVYEWNRLPVDKIQHMKPVNTKMRTEIENKRCNFQAELGDREKDTDRKRAL